MTLTRDWADVLNPLGSRAAFDTTIEAARTQLAERSARLTLRDVAIDGDELAFSAEIAVVAGDNRVAHDAIIFDSHIGRRQKGFVLLVRARPLDLSGELQGSRRRLELDAPEVTDC